MKNINKPASFNKSNIDDLPQTPGVYLFFSKDKKILYIGKANNLRARVRSYLSINLIEKTEKMIKLTKSFSFIRVSSEVEALLLEAKLVNKHLPKYNIALRDEKSPLYIKLTKDKYPQVLSVRKKDAYSGAFYTIGPFPSSASVKNVLQMIRKAFPYSDHKLGKNPCFYSHIGLCDPCPNEIAKITDTYLKKEKRQEYLKNIRTIRSYLNGNVTKVKKDLISKMNQYSKIKDYENALIQRKKLYYLEYITKPSKDIDEYLKNPNFIEDVRKNESKALHQLLLKYFINTQLPSRIECFDVAHLSGKKPTASMVTFIDGEPEKTLYRHFKIRQKRPNSDYHSLFEVAQRRKHNFKSWGKPNLIIVDGGRSQVSAFYDALSNENIPIIGFAKMRNNIIIKNGKKFHNIERFDKEVLFLLKRIQDEAHRFARRLHHIYIKKELLSV